MLSTSIKSNESRCDSFGKAMLPHERWFAEGRRGGAPVVAAAAGVLLLLLTFQCAAAQNNANVGETNSRPHSLPHFKPNRSTIVQLFEWKFDDVAKECEQFLGPRGLAGVQLSPVTEHLVYQSESLSRPWWERYHPISYTIASRSGNEEDFLAMSRSCNAAGVRIYVDVVLNHMAGSPPGIAGAEKGADSFKGSAGSTANVSALDYPGVPYSGKDFHKPCNVTDGNTDGHEVRNCQFDGRPDLDHSLAVVRQRIVELLDKLVDLGVAGFHVDAAKYMWPIDLKSIFDAVKNLNSAEFEFPEEARPFFYQDVVDLGTEAISKTEYSGHGVVTEYLYAAELATVFSRKVPLSALINWGPAMGFLPHHEALVFVDTPASQRGALKQLGSNQLLTHRWRSRYIMANAFMLAHPYGGVKRIMSSYRLEADALDAGPPTAEGDEDAAIRSPEFDDEGECSADVGWVCEHRWPAIANMVDLANSLDELHDGVNNFQTDGLQHVSFCRGSKAFFALNNDVALDYETQVFACLEPGTYCDVISGGRTADGADCRGKRIVVDAERKTRIALPAIGYTQSEEEDEHNEPVSGFGVIAIFAGSKLSDETGAAVAPAGGDNSPAGGKGKGATDDGKEAVVDVKNEYEFVTVEPEEKTEEEPKEEADEEPKEEADEELTTEANEPVEDVPVTASDAGAEEVDALNEGEVEKVEPAVEEVAEEETPAAEAETAKAAEIRDVNVESMKFSAID